ncbi:protein translocase subunit SecF [Brevibacterium sp. 50QC2O2]|uniref:protein translocase subunit SecF n=1 Tax=Brevibacterium TaxID=1696 RepID=UPI00211C2424|nr:protein translocase subunit SecF [Brevibacterium sp. 91QC2O2]MCQ9384059.1 protein translocase subunit SecF [Brevibacterium sp. 68QC2CO]MCQ9389087.1 protein translocase subunit SecF [Brevibacterium sp. 50QC2O2]
MKRFFEWGNRLHTGESSIPFVGKSKLWLTIAAVLTVLSILVPVFGGFNLGIDFRGGSQFQVDHVATDKVDAASQAVTDAVGAANPSVVPTTNDTLKIETDQLSDEQMQQVRDSLVSHLQVDNSDVTSNFIGPQWGADVTQKMARALIIFVALAMVFMAIYFRTWKMSLAAILGLVFVMVLTMGIYSATGFEVTPEAVIGFLTVLSFSLYDTVVVFDKIRETTQDFGSAKDRTFSELVNLGINQTTVRSINTTIIAALPIGAILFIGVFLLGAGTLTDISLSLFVGTVVAAASTLFVASPLYAVLRSTEKKVKEQEARVLEARPAA